MMTRLSLLVLLAGCSESSMLEARAMADFNDSESAAADLSSQVFFDVHPTSLLNEDNAFRVLPQTFGPFGSRDASLNIGSVQLETPTELEGRIEAAIVTPLAAGAELPTEYGPIAATVAVTRGSRTVQNYSAITDDFGRYQTLLVADGYEMRVIPDNPEVPVYVSQETVGTAGAVIDVVIDTGMPIWGQVRYPSLASADPFRVHVVDAHGVRSATALTDEDGFYLIRVDPDNGPFTVVCEGRDDGRDPILTSDLVDPFDAVDTGIPLELTSVQVDFDYPAFRAAAASGRVLDAAGEPVEDVEVRFTSTALSGYDGLEADLQVTRVTDASGNFDISLLTGDYRVDFMPEGARSPTQVDVSVSGNNALGTIELQPLMAVSGMVLDEDQASVGSTQVTCKETGFGMRSWSTFASKKGAFDLELPATDLECTLTPPDTSQNATTRISVDGALLDGNLELVLSRGQLAMGTLDLGGEPEAFAVVEIRDGHERLLGSAITDEAGFFQVRVQLFDDEGETTTP